MRGALIAAVACISTLPVQAHAALIITEIAWMGSATGANDEWIELHNTSDTPVAVDGWRLTDNAAIDIDLSGTIGARAYAVFERTDDTSAPGTMFASYTGALSNAGATLSLFRADGTIEDQVSGGEDWQSIGGDNATKQTPQYNLTQWVTSLPTPGFGTSATVDIQPDDVDEEERVYSSARDTQEENVVIELQLPDTELALQIKSPTIAYVNQELSFKAEAQGIGKSLLDSLVYTWNFGDLSVSTGKELTHAYAYPGEYVTTLHGTFARHEQVVRKTITVLPVAFSLSRAQTGEVLLHNNAKYEVDVSGYALNGSKHMVFPPRTILLAQGTIRVPDSRIGNASRAVVLYDQTGTQVAVLGDTEKIAPAALPRSALAPTAASLTQTPTESEAITAEKGNFSFANDVSVSEGEPLQEWDVPTEPQLAAVSAFDAIDTNEAAKERVLPYLGFAGVVALGIFAVFFTRKT